MSGDPVADSADPGDPGEDVVDLDEEDPAAVAARQAPYVFDSSHVEIGAPHLDEVFSSFDANWAHRGSMLHSAAKAADVPDLLLRELVFIAEYRLHRAEIGKAGCELEPQRSVNGFSYPPAIREVADPVVELWRALLPTVSAPLARARLSDLLVSKRDGNLPDLAIQAVEGYLAFAGGTRELSFDVVDALLRAWMLASRFRLAPQQEQVRAKLIAAATLVVASGESPGSSVPMLAALCSESITDPALNERLDDLLAQAMTAYRFRRHIVAELATLRRARAASDDERRRIDREQAEAALAHAEASTGAVRLALLQEAIGVARRFNVADVRARATALLQRTDPAELGLKPIIVTSSLPVDAVTPFVAPFTMSPDWRDGLDYFLSTESPMGSLDRLRKTESKLGGVSVLARILPPLVVRHDGLPAWQPPSEEAHDAYSLAQLATSNAETWGRILADGLRRFAEEYGPPDETEIAVEIATRWGCDEQLAGALARSLGHFWRGDFEACAHVVVPRIETAMRGLLRELDEAVYREQTGHDPGTFPGMYAMLGALTDLGFDEDWAYFLKTLLLEPPGLNVRNNLAHGSLPAIGPVYAALVLRAAALLIVLTPPQPGGLGEGPSELRLVTPDEQAATRAGLLERIGAPVRNSIRLPEQRLMVELPRWVLGVARGVRQIQAFMQSIPRRAGR